MKRIILAIAVVGALIVAVPASSTPYATNDVVFSSDFFSATLTSTKGISHFVYTLCDGTTRKEEVRGEQRSITIGPFDSQIESVTIKAGRSVDTEASGFTGDCGDDPKK